MSTMTRMILVLAGYLLACLIASGAVYVNQWLTPSAVSQASGGMAAFGDAVLFLGTFGCCALFPSGLGLYFLIASRRQ